MHCRAVEISRVTWIGASKADVMSTSEDAFQETLSPQCS